MSPPTISTLGELKASGHVQKSLRPEIRDNLLEALRDGRDPWPGLHGFELTVIPQLERALLAGHDVVFPCPRSPSSPMSCPAINARSSCGITVDSKPCRPGHGSRPSRSAESRLSRISARKVFCT